MRRWLWTAAGVLALGLAVAGLAVPGLPATPFAVLAAGAFARGSPRWRARLLAGRLGPMIEAWEQKRAVPARAKASALTLMAATLAAGWWIGLSSALLAGQATAMALVGSWLMTRPSA